MMLLARVVGGLLVVGAVSGLLCSDMLDTPESKRWSVGELRTAPPKEIVACLAHLGKDELPLAEAQYIWRTLVEHYGGATGVPDDKLAQLRWVTRALEPTDYDNLTLSDIDVVENFGLDYGLSAAQLAAIAERVREDWGGKDPEDYTHYDLVALRQILCAFNRSEIERVHPAAYREAAAALGKLRGCAQEVLEGLARLAVAEEAFGPPAGWGGATLDAVGAVVAGLPPELARQLRRRSGRHTLGSRISPETARRKMTTTRILMTMGQAWGAERAMEPREDKKPVQASAPLPAATARTAARELRETAAAREQALLHLRTWLHHNPDVKNVRHDETFLLRFLRQKKFSIPMAQQTLLKYLSLRQYYPEMSRALDCDELPMKDIIASGYITISPVRDSQGRKVIIYNMGKFDARKYGCWEMARAHVLVYESLLEEQENQVLGFTHVGDGGGVGAAHVAAWSPVHFARLMKWGEQSMPMRHKEVHLINVPNSIKYVLDFACSKLPPKLVSRLHIHSNLKTLHAKVDVACLPEAYGGQLPAADLISHTRAVLLQQRARVLGLDFMQILSTRGIQSSRSKPTNVDAIQGSFRKLDID